jgi:RHS repeat-associated protein
MSVTDQSGNQTYYLHDGLGSMALMTDASGAVTGTYTYDVFGPLMAHTGASTEFSYTGEQNDPNGLEYLRARYYEPGTGRFLSRDPLGGGYPYAGGNPVNMLDPTGLFMMCFPIPEYNNAIGCAESSDIGFPACDRATDDCYLYDGDGVPGHEYERIELVDRHGDACVFADARPRHCDAMQDAQYTAGEEEFLVGTVIAIQDVLSELGQDRLTRDQALLFRAVLHRTSTSGGDPVACFISVTSTIGGGFGVVDGVVTGNPFLVGAGLAFLTGGIAGMAYYC